MYFDRKGTLLQVWLIAILKIVVAKNNYPNMTGWFSSQNNISKRQVFGSIAIRLKFRPKRRIPDDVDCLVALPKIERVTWSLRLNHQGKTSPAELPVTMCFQVALFPQVLEARPGLPSRRLVTLKPTDPR